MPTREPIPTTVRVPAIYATSRFEIHRRAGMGDPRLLPEYTPDLTQADRERLNSSQAAVREARRLAAEMDEGKPVIVPASFGRLFREITDTRWYRLCNWIQLDADDAVTPANDGPLI